MIGLTKLLSGTATVSEAIKYGSQGRSSHQPVDLLQFSSNKQPIVVWNITNRCNLSCRHCYLNAQDKDYQGELSFKQAKTFILDLAKMKIPVLLFSGGEPLIRADLFRLARLACEKGLRTVLSTNGILINKAIAREIKEAGFQYVGVSIDGVQPTHDTFRNLPGAFSKAMQGMRNCLSAKIKTGVRFTVTKYNYKDLPRIIDLVVAEGITRFCIYHLVCTGRGKEIADADLSLEQKRRMINFLIEKALQLRARKVKLEILTVDNHADAVYLSHYVKDHIPERAEEVRELLKMQGGCSAGERIANVDPQGAVHPCQFWPELTLGNVKERPLSEIWNDESNKFLQKLRCKSRYLKGRCRDCAYNEICAGCRVRARAKTGDIWSEDPGCYLKDAEIK